jgi:UPF0271 protein
MIKVVDINCDMGEGFGAWSMGIDHQLLPFVTSANIACGFHAGDPDIMVATISAAKRANVAIGAHPGFPDLQGFGRRHLAMPSKSVVNIVQYQVGAMVALAGAQGVDVRHLKLHGALGSFAIREPEIARACFEAALVVNPDMVLLVQAATSMQVVAESLKCRWAAEIFADRAYNDDASLVARDRPGAVFQDPDVVVDRVRKMLDAGAIICESGLQIPAKIDSICVHGDNPNSIVIARRLHQSLTDDGYQLKRFV